MIHTSARTTIAMLGAASLLAAPASWAIDDKPPTGAQQGKGSEQPAPAPKDECNPAIPLAAKDYFLIVEYPKGPEPKVYKIKRPGKQEEKVDSLVDLRIPQGRTVIYEARHINTLVWNVEIKDTVTSTASDVSKFLEAASPWKKQHEEALKKLEKGGAVASFHTTLTGADAEVAKGLEGHIEAFEKLITTFRTGESIQPTLTDIAQSHVRCPEKSLKTAAQSAMRRAMAFPSTFAGAEPIIEEYYKYYAVGEKPGTVNASDLLRAILRLRDTDPDPEVKVAGVTGATALTDDAAAVIRGQYSPLGTGFRIKKEREYAVLSEKYDEVVAEADRLIRIAEATLLIQKEEKDRLTAYESIRKTKALLDRVKVAKAGADSLVPSFRDAATLYDRIQSAKFAVRSRPVRLGEDELVTFDPTYIEVNPPVKQTTTQPPVIGEKTALEPIRPSTPVILASFASLTLDDEGEDPSPSGDSEKDESKKEEKPSPDRGSARSEGWTTDISTGFFFSELTDHSYVKRSVRGKNRIRRIGAEDEFSTSYGVLLHVFEGGGSRPRLALSLGLATGGDSDFQFFVGPSFLFGSKRRLALTAGLSAGKVKRLNGVRENQRFDEETIPTTDVFRVAPFVGLTYKLD